MLNYHEIMVKNTLPYKVERLVVKLTKDYALNDVIVLFLRKTLLIVYFFFKGFKHFVTRLKTFKSNLLYQHNPVFDTTISIEDTTEVLIFERDPGHWFFYDIIKLIPNTQLICPKKSLMNNYKSAEEYVQYCVTHLNSQIRAIHFLTIEGLTEHPDLLKKYLSKETCRKYATLHQLPKSRKDLMDLKQTAKLFDQIVVLTKVMETELKSLGIPNITTVEHYPTNYTMVQPSKSKAKKQLNIETSKAVLSLIGEFREDKGVELLIDALALLDMDLKEKIFINIAGKNYSDSCYQLILSMLPQLGIEHRIDIRSKHLSDEEFAVNIAASDFMLLPYDYKHDHRFSGPLSAAIWFDVPVISSDSGVVGYTVKRYDIGSIFANNAAQSFADCLGRVTQEADSSCRGLKDYKALIKPEQSIDLYKALYYFA